jgi:hypothetical protein
VALPAISGITTSTENNGHTPNFCLAEIEFYRVAPMTVTASEPPQILRPDYSADDLLNQKECL